MRIEDKATLDAFRRASPRCEHCRKAGGVQVHHWRHRGIGDACRIDHPANLVALCAPCHCREDNGQILAITLLAIIAEREKLRQDDIRNAIHLLLRLPFRRPEEVRRLPFEALEFYALVGPSGRPTLAGQMCRIEGKVLR